MLQTWIIALCSLGYMGVLFTVAYYGESAKRRHRWLPPKSVIYSLSIAVYCTSWTYYGVVGSTTTSGWNYLSTYLGPILTLVLGYPFLKRISQICIDNNITSIADFISTRYGKAQYLAVLVTCIAILGTLPYIALQLKAIAASVDTLTMRSDLHANSEDIFFWADTAFDVALIMALFSILFGTRSVSVSDQHEGIMLAIAFESIVKLCALLAIGFLAVYGLFDGPADLYQVATNAETPHFLLDPYSLQEFFSSTFIAQTILSMAAIFCLPRQFHVMFVQASNKEHLKTTRWLLPLYLIITCLVIVPISLAGSEVFKGQLVNPETYVLALPLETNNQWLTLTAFIGGISAASGMIIVAVITLSTMISNDIVMPLLIRLSRNKLKDSYNFAPKLLIIRRITIVTILILSYWYYRYINIVEGLVSIGLVSFVAAAQFAPALIAAVYWKKASRFGATIGLGAGLFIWLYTLFLPTLTNAGWMNSCLINNNHWGIDFLKSYPMFSIEGLSPIAMSTFVSLGANILFFIAGSFIRPPDLSERIQTANFTKTTLEESYTSELPRWGIVTVGELKLLATKFIGIEDTQKAFSEYNHRLVSPLSSNAKADSDVVDYVEHLLSGAIGSASAKVIISSLLNKKDLPIEDVYHLVGEASQAVHFTQELLSTTIEHIEQGISVVDSDLNLVAWNARYIEIYRYPKGFIKPGMPIEEVIRFNALAGECGPGEIENHISKRLAYLRSGNPHNFVRQRANGSVIMIQGKPMNGGGVVTSFTDITEQKKIENELREINDNLELIVEGRTKELSVVNQELQQAITSKIQFLAAVNHDVMQPLNAARLFTSALTQQIGNPNGLPERIIRSLRSAEEIIHTLLDISKLDSGAIKPKLTVFNINDIIMRLDEEFSVIATERNIRLETINCNTSVYSDNHLLRRILQNFVSNALNYNRPQGKVVLGCRRENLDSDSPTLVISVHDTGIGIKPCDLNSIFKEFKQLDNQKESNGKGLGLGLAIAKRISVLLEHPIDVKSTIGKGSTFSIKVPLYQSQEQAPFDDSSNIKKIALRWNNNELSSQHPILCIDNDQDVLDGMDALLSAWECDVISVKSLEDAMTQFKTHSIPPAIMLVDYHLDNGATGLDAMQKITQHFDSKIPGVLITALISEELKNSCHELGFSYLTKPINPAALRKLIIKYS